MVLSGVTDRIRLARTVALGAVGLQPKGAGFGPLLDIALAALHTCGPVDPVAHQGWLTELAAAEEAAARRSAPFVALTEREQATLRALCEGLMVHDISRRWTVSEATVRSHVQKILAKLGVGSQVQAVGLALREGWVPVPAG